MATAVPLLPPPPRRRVLDAVALEGLEDFLAPTAAEGRALIKSRDFPELQGLDLQPSDVQVVLFDKYSVDSFAACFAARKLLGENAQYVGVDRSTTAEELSFDIEFHEKVIAMVGICWRHEEMHSLIAECPWVLVLENHASAEQELGQLSYPTLVTIVDPSMGAAAMAWNFFQPGEPVPHLLRYIEDADLGRELLKDAAAFADAFGFDHLSSTGLRPKTGEMKFTDELFMEFECLFNDSGRPAIELAIEEGKQLVDSIQEQGSEAFQSCKVKILRAFPAWRCAVIELASPAAGRIGETALREMLKQSYPEVAHRCLAAVYEVVSGKYVRVVLRSLDGGPHVNEIGSIYGGCGHPHHAFFSMPLESWEEIWAPPELVLWDVPCSFPSSLTLSQGDLITIARKGERFRESPFEEWSWGSRHNEAKGAIEEGWVPSLAHTLFISTRSTPSTDEGVESVEEGDLLVAWAQRGDYYWASRCNSCLANVLQSPKAWFPTAGLLPVQARSVRELLAPVSNIGVQGGA